MRAGPKKAPLAVKTQARKTPESGNARSRSRNATATRASLLEAAANLFSRQGYDGTSIHEIARAAGYTIGAIYRHFDSKSSIMLEVVKYSISHVPAIKPVNPGRDPAVVLSDLVVQFALPEMARVRRLSKELHAAARSDAQAAKLIIDFYRRRSADVVELLGGALNDTPEAIAMVEAKATILLMLMVGVAHIETIAPDRLLQSAWHAELRTMVSRFVDSTAPLIARKSAVARRS
jgi:AcrR family transcriptional regulator